MVDTSNITFIGMGAFTDIRDMKMHENNTRKIGINVNDDNEKERTYVIDEQDYINYGIERELMGRFKVITYTKDYSIEDYKNILLNSTISPLKGFIECVKLLSDNTIEEIIYDDAFIEEVALLAYNYKFGARGLQKIMASLKSYLLMDILNKKFTRIELTVDLLKEVKKTAVRKC